MDQDWVWSGLVQPLKDPILSDLIGYQTRPDPIRSDSVGGPISITTESHCWVQFAGTVMIFPRSPAWLSVPAYLCTNCKLSRSVHADARNVSG